MIPKRIEMPVQVEEILGKLREHGYEAFAVGGCVRDAILGRIPGDWDITTSAHPEEDIINELDKAASGKGNGNPADVLLTLLDNLGFTDNYMECMIPTGGVYPIATANVKEDISAPLMSRFAVIDIPDYTQEEKKIIFSKFALPKVLKRIGLLQGEIVLTEEGLDELIEQYKNTSGIRDLEQAAEHLAANALYQIEVDHVKQVVFDAEMVKKLFA